MEENNKNYEPLASKLRRTSRNCEKKKKLIIKKTCIRVKKLSTECWIHVFSNQYTMKCEEMKNKEHLLRRRYTLV